MGLNGRGTDLAGSFVKMAGCEIAYLCDVDGAPWTKPRP